VLIIAFFQCNSSWELDFHWFHQLCGHQFQKLFPRNITRKCLRTDILGTKHGAMGNSITSRISLNSTNPTIVPDKTLVNDNFQKAYIEVVNNSPFFELKDGKGNAMDTTLIKVFAKSSGGEFINKVVMQAPQEKVVDYDKDEFGNKIYSGVKDALEAYIASIDKGKIGEINDDDEIAALTELNQKL
jgi:hypothetical protein